MSLCSEQRSSSCRFFLYKVFYFYRNYNHTRSNTGTEPRDGSGHIAPHPRGTRTEANCTDSLTWSITNLFGEIIFRVFWAIIELGPTGGLWSDDKIASLQYVGRATQSRALLSLQNSLPRDCFDCLDGHFFRKHYYTVSCVIFHSGCPLNFHTLKQSWAHEIVKLRMSFFFKSKLVSESVLIFV